jgi:hypothetical protein
MRTSGAVSDEQLGGPSSLIFTVQITAYPRYCGDGSNEHFVAQAIAPNGEALRYRGEGPTLASALQQLVDVIKREKHESGAK